MDLLVITLHRLPDELVNADEKAIITHLGKYSDKRFYAFMR